MDATHDSIAGQSVNESFWHLAYRFIWPFLYFRDVTIGDRTQREQSYRHNRAMRLYLPAFMLKWAVLTGIMYSAGGALGRMGADIPAAGFFVVGCWTLIMVVLLVIDWFWLGRFRDLF